MTHPTDLNAATNRNLADLPVPASSAVPPSQTPKLQLLGQVWADRYELVRELRTGVFLARDRTNGREVRLVVFAPDQISMIRRATGIESQATIAVREIHQTAQCCFYSTEPYEGITFREELNRRTASEQRFSVDEVRRIGEQLIDAANQAGNSHFPCPTLDSIILAPDGRVRITETALFASTGDPADCQRMIAATLYELLTTTTPNPASLPLERVRGQIPSAFSTTIQRALNARPIRQYRTLSAFRRALGQKTSSQSSRDGLVMAGVTAVALVAVSLLWWATRPLPSKFSKADYSQKLGTVQELQKRAEHLDGSLTSDAKAARDELEKWQREVNTAREGNKTVQLEYAEQRLAEIQPTAEIRAQLGELWQTHRQKAKWLSQASGELTRAQSLAAENQFDQAIADLERAEVSYSGFSTWREQAERALILARQIKGELPRLKSAVPSTPFAYDWPSQVVETLSDTLAEGDGRSVVELLELVRSELPKIEPLVAVRDRATHAVQATEDLVEVSEVREQRQTGIDRFRLADDQLRRGELSESMTGYESAITQLDSLPPVAIQLLVTAATKSRDAGNRESALKLINKAISLKTNAADGLASLGEAYLLRAEMRSDRQESRAIIDDCRRALELRPQLVGAFLLRATIYNSTGQYGLAVADCDAALKIDTTSERGLTQRGIARYHTGDLNGALSDLNSVLQTNPKQIQAIAYRGMVQLDRRDYALANSDFTAVLDASPNDLVARSGRANALRLIGDFEAAIRDCDELLRLQPESADGYLIRGAAKMGLGTLEPAIVDLQRAAELNPQDAAALVFLAQVWNQKSDWKRSIAVCDTALQRAPQSTAVLVERGRANLIGGQVNAAIADFNAALEVNSRDQNAPLERADLLFQLQRRTEASRDYNRILELAPDVVPALVGRAAIWIAQANYKKAVEDCDRAIAVDPRAVLAWRTRAVARFKLTEYDRVIEDCTAALQLDNKPAEVYAYRGAAYFETKEFEKSVQDCDAAIERNPQLAWCYRTRAKAWFERGDKERSRLDYETALRLEKK